METPLQMATWTEVDVSKAVRPDLPGVAMLNFAGGIRIRKSVSMEG